MDPRRKQLKFFRGGVKPIRRHRIDIFHRRKHRIGDIQSWCGSREKETIVMLCNEPTPFGTGHNYRRTAKQRGTNESVCTEEKRTENNGKYSLSPPPFTHNHQQRQGEGEFIGGAGLIPVG
jgi:hypothetical protein